MATIQVRDIPDDVYSTIRQRAQAAGQSMQAYMKRVIEDFARVPTDAELFGQLEDLVAGGGVELDPDELLAALDVDRR